MNRWTVRAGAVLAGVAAFACGDDDPTGPGGQGSPLVFSDFQAAAVVIGQPDGSSSSANAGGMTGPSGLDAPFGTVAAGSLYVPDTDNHRVLGFAVLPGADGAAADFVLGQTDMTTSTSGVSATKFTFPFSSAVGEGKLFVADYNNHRVLIWNALPSTTAASADVVVGQADLTSALAATTQTGLRNPTAVAVAGGKLFVGEINNRRVLIWNTVPTTNGAAADVVVGQADFTTQTGGAVEGWVAPWSMWTDGTRLVVGDAILRRVLIWNSIPTANDAPADVVVGAPDLSTSGTLEPRGVASDGTSLFISDYENHRVLIYRPFPTTNDPSPSGVLGQGDLAHTTQNDDDQDGIPDANPTRRTLHFPTGLTVIGDQLLVTDHGNNRIVAFTSQ